MADGSFSGVSDSAQLSSLGDDPVAVCHQFQWAKIYSGQVADIARAGHAISAISRLLQNSDIEQDCAHGQMLSKYITGGLQDALALIGGQLSEMTEKIVELANREQEAPPTMQ